MPEVTSGETPPVPVVTVERRPPVARVILDRPDARNALSRAVVAGLRAAATQLAADPEIHAVVLTGGGDKVFCAGADLKERHGFTLEDTKAFVTELGRVFDLWAALPKLTLCVLNGSAFGGGVELALTCDLRLAVEGSELALTEVRLGILPGAGGTQRLPRLVGVARAKEMILLGRRVSAARALEMGLVNAVVSRAELAGVESAWLEEAAGCAPISVAMAKKAIDETGGMSLEDGLRLERRCYDVTVVTEDRNEGIRAFRDKRVPRFMGK
jgi:enoyl-CoA hydratase/carnithine racemase